MVEIAKVRLLEIRERLRPLTVEQTVSAYNGGTVHRLKREMAVATA